MRCAERRAGTTAVRATRGTGTRAAFTLVEVMVALAVSAAVVLGARLLLESLGSEASRIVGAARSADADANGERLLRAVVGRLEVGTRDGGSFGGDERSATFTSWCDVPRGWQERCRVTLEITRAERGLAVALAFGGEKIIVRQAEHDVTLRYLADPGAGGVWVSRWGSGLTAPRAIGLLIDGDTVIVRIGERG
jgi:prepilin-type N-terminal cleavage/methylation domain-containing protein